MPNYHDVSIAKHNIFFAELARHSLVATAARTAQLDRSNMYKLKDKDEAFAERWREALEIYADSLEAAAHQRAVAGFKKGVWHQGQQVGEEIQYSDSLLLAMLRAKRKEYGDKSKIELTGADGGPVKVEESPTEIARSIAFALALGLRAKEQQAAVEPADGSDLA